MKDPEKQGKLTTHLWLDHRTEAEVCTEEGKEAGGVLG